MSKYEELCQKIDVLSRFVPMTDAAEKFFSSRYRIAFALNTKTLSDKILAEPLTDAEWTEFSDFLRAL